MGSLCSKYSNVETKDVVLIQELNPKLLERCPVLKDL